MSSETPIADSIEESAGPVVPDPDDERPEETEQAPVQEPQRSTEGLQAVDDSGRPVSDPVNHASHVVGYMDRNGRIIPA